MKVYMDNAATTQTKSEVLSAMLPYFSEIYGNPSSIHAYGQAASSAVDKARMQVAHALCAQPDEIIFTSGGSESDNTAIIGTAHRLRNKGNHIITTAVEHHAVLHSCKRLENEGFTVTYLPVDEYGRVTASQVDKAITPQTVLVSVMFANNEVGTIMPIAEIGAVCKNRGVLFHTDAVQAAGHIKIDVNAMNIDMLSLSAHKFHGPKGVGALYVRRGVSLPSLIVGGEQERKRRAGTENVPGIVGLGKAIELATQNIDSVTPKMVLLRDRLIEKITSGISEVKLNGHPTERLPNNVNVSILYIEGESTLLSLDMDGIAASSGSACTTGSLDPSHVLLAMGLTHEVAHGSLRLTLSEFTTEAEVDYVVEKLTAAVKRLRAMSPLYNPGKSVTECSKKTCCACDKD